MAAATRWSVLMIVCVTGAAAASGVEPETQWVRFYDGGKDVPARGGITVIDEGGAIYAAVSRGNAPEDQDIVLLKYDPSGDLLWSKSYDGPGGGADNPTDIECTAEGVSLVGTSLGLSGPQTVLLNYDSDGVLLNEQRTIGNEFAGFLRPQLAIGGDGRRVMATDDNAGTGTIEAYTAGGELIYATPLAFAGFSGVSALEATGDQGVDLVTVESVDGSMAYVVRRYDGEGNEQWCHVEPGDTGLVLSEAFVIPQPDGGVVVAGSPEIPCVTVKTRVWRLLADGTLWWSKDLPEGNCDFSQVTGAVAGPGDSTYLIDSGTGLSRLTRIDPDGTLAWSTPFGMDDFIIGFRAVGVTAGGQIIVAGIQAPPSFSDVDIRVVRFNPDGDVCWTTVFQGPEGGPDSVGEIATGMYQNVVVAGTTQGDYAANQQALTLFYDFANCAADLDGSGDVGVSDLVVWIVAWGSSCVPGEPCPADIDGDGSVGVGDLIALIVAWGPCGGG